MITSSTPAWITFLMLAHIMLMSPAAWPLVLTCVLFLLLNTLHSSIRQYNFFQAAKISSKHIVQDLSTEDSTKIKNAIALTEKYFGHTPSIFIIKDDDANAYACPIKENNKAVIGITSSGIKTWSCEEITAVIGHELGHIQNKHSSKTISIQIGLELMLYIIVLCLCLVLHISSKLIGYDTEFNWLVIAPIILITAHYGSSLMRTNMQSMEFEADAYCTKHYGKTHMLMALSKISSDAITHQNIQTRITAINKLNHD